MLSVLYSFFSPMKEHAILDKRIRRLMRTVIAESVRKQQTIAQCYSCHGAKRQQLLCLPMHSILHLRDSFLGPESSSMILDNQRCWGFFLVLSQHKNILQLMHCFSWLDFTLAYQIVNITTCQDGGDVFTDRSSNLCYYFLGSWILGPLR